MPLFEGPGHDAVHVSEIGLASTDDSIIVARAAADDRTVVSCDHDFVQLLYASGGTKPSLLLTRKVDTLTSTELAELVLAALSRELMDFLDAGVIATLTPDRVRVRPSPLRPTTSSVHKK
ncbi:DUF5615 family PIN-like protein [Jiangella gansuensis]|uniref:DUF5615 family PIN-like protein n=1 Tax=Jiangella gansuensis TaxID=281473 RepID=UPI00047D8384|nr:DUF5615 family PIN-like protein [Jiangella gansuensis]